MFDDVTFSRVWGHCSPRDPRAGDRRAGALLLLPTRPRDGSRRTSLPRTYADDRVWDVVCGGGRGGDGGRVGAATRRRGHGTAVEVVALVDVTVLSRWPWDMSLRVGLWRGGSNGPSGHRGEGEREPPAWTRPRDGRGRRRLFLNCPRAWLTPDRLRLFDTLHTHVTVVPTKGAALCHGNSSLWCGLTVLPTASARCGHLSSHALLSHGYADATVLSFHGRFGRLRAPIAAPPHLAPVGIAEPVLILNGPPVGLIPDASSTTLR